MLHLVSHRGTYGIHQVFVPGRTHHSSHREVGTVERLVGILALRVDAKSSRTIGYNRSRNAQTLNTIHLTCGTLYQLTLVTNGSLHLALILTRRTYHQLNLLIESHRIDDILDRRHTQLWVLCLHYESRRKKHT